jgi:adenosylcobyric acid synthase
MAQTERPPTLAPWSRLTRQRDGSSVLDGAISPCGRIMGTYVHGLFDSLPFTAALVDRLRARRGFSPLDPLLWQAHREFLAARYAGLAHLLRSHLDLAAVWAALGVRADHTSRSR